MCVDFESAPVFSWDRYENFQHASGQLLVNFNVNDPCGTTLI